MNNVSLYNQVCNLKDRLELHPDSTREQISQALALIKQVNEILDIKERRS